MRCLLKAFASYHSLLLVLPSFFFKVKFTFLCAGHCSPLVNIILHSVSADGNPNGTIGAITTLFVNFTPFKRNISYIIHKMLSAQLKELERDGLIVRKEYPQIPPKVEYSRSEKGLSLFPIIEAMCIWGRKNAFSING